MPPIQECARADDGSVDTKKSSNQTLSIAPSFATIDSTNLADLNNHAARILQAEGLLESTQDREQERSLGDSEKTMKFSKKQFRRTRKSAVNQTASDSLAFSPDNFFAASSMSDKEVGNSTTPSPTRASSGRKMGSPTSVIPAAGNSVPRPSPSRAPNTIRPSKTFVSIDGSDDSSNDIRERFSPSIRTEDESHSFATEIVNSHFKSPLDRLHDLINGSLCLSKKSLIGHFQNQCTEETLVDDAWEKSVIDDVVDALVEEDSEDDDDTHSGTFATYDEEDTFASSLRSRSNNVKLSDSSHSRLRRGRSLTARHGYNSGESASPRASRSRSTLDSSGTSGSRTKSRRTPDADEASCEDTIVAESVLSQDHSTWKSMTNTAAAGETVPPSEVAEDGSNAKSSNDTMPLAPWKDPRESSESAGEMYFKVRSESERLLLCFDASFNITEPLSSTETPHNRDSASSSRFR